MSDRAPLFAYIGLYKFGKEKSKIKLNRNRIIIFIIIFAALVYIANIYISCLI
jgi:preprotein translocase subunit Sec61beta